MAETLDIRGTNVKIRRPWGVFFLAIVTLGIYYFVWYYKVNRELRDAAGIEVSPGVAVLAVTLGAFLIVPPFVSMYRTFGRIRTAQQQVGLADPASPGIGLLLYFLALVFLPIELLYAQGQLNRLWQHAAAQT